MIEEYIARRQKLTQTLPDNSIVIICSGSEIRKTADEAYDFAVDYNLFYLTGIKQAQTTLMIAKNSLEAKEYLFIQKYDALKEVWTGVRLKSQEAKKISAISNVLFEEDFNDKLQKQIEDLAFNGTVHIFLDYETAANYGSFDCFKSVMDFKSELEKISNVEIHDVSKELKLMRMIKSENEIKELRKAISNTKKGLEEVLKNLKPNKYEFEMANLFNYVISKDNNAKLSFHTIAASGKNAIILHYPNPKEKMEDGDLLLLDLGSDHNEYKADISRTYPINGIFDVRQKEIYEGVLACNKHIIAMIKPGLTISDLQKETRAFFFKFLKKIGLIKKEEEVSKYYYHNISHHLGLDTHDISLREMPLKEGNVITVEPGLYIKEFGIGVRIEDDVLVTKNGAECLSKDIIKEVKDIELFMNK